MEMNTAHPTASALPVHSRMAYPQQVPGVSAITTTTAVVNAGVQKSIYSAPASPAYPASGERGTEASAHAAPVPSCLHPPPSTPKKDHLEDAGMLRKIRELLMSPGGCKLETLRLEGALEEAVNVIKDRYLISLVPNNISAASAAKTPASYRHLIDLSAGSLKCTDVFTEEHFLCKIINEPLHKVQLAYFNLQQDSERSHCELYGHKLIRDVRDVVRMSKERTYVIIPAAVGEDGGMHAAPDAKCMYEDLHTYIRNKKKRLTECEARPLFHQICQTVMVCHRNGIVLRDLKLKRFYFIDEARTKLQYESLEGSMILDNPDNDVLSDKIGCPLYTAPELLCPNPTYNGKPADMWSLGVILYTMLVGQYPFYEKGNWSLIRVIRHGNVHIPAHLSRPVRYLLLSLLHKNHTERLPIEYIFLSPWLKMTPTLYVPVDAVIPDDESDDEQSGATMEPLDYSCATKTQSMQPDIDEHQQQQQQHYSNDDDVEMG